MTSPRWRRWSHNAQPSPDPACDRPRPFRLCDAAFRQSRARQHFGWRDGERPRHPEADLAIASGRRDPLRFASDPYEPRLLGALRAAPIPLDAPRGDPAHSWPLHSVPADQPRDRNPRRAQPVWDREGIRAGTRGFLGQFALARRAASDSVADRLDSRLPRHSFLAEAQAVLPAREGPHAFDRGAPARAGAARLLSGRRADPGGGSGPGMAGAHDVSRARRDAGSERGPSGRAHADARLPGRGAGRHALRPGLPTVEGAPRRLDPADLSRPHDSRSARLQRAGGEPHQQHPARACVRRPRPLLDVPHPHPWRRSRACRAPSAAEQAVLERVHAAPGVRLACQLRPTRDITLVPMLSPYATTVDAYRTGARLFGSRALCCHHVCRHARIEPTGREAPAVRHRVHHQPVSQRREQRGVERRRRAQPGAGRRAAGAVRHERPARRRLPAGDRRQRCNRQPESRVSTARCPMRWSSRSASASASTPA